MKPPACEVARESSNPQMKTGNLFARAASWLLAPPEKPFRFRTVDVALWWILISLAAILLIADHPYLALTLAISGGTMIGILHVVGSNPRW